MDSLQLLTCLFVCRHDGTVCYDFSMSCDGEEDCSDGSDEWYCGCPTDHMECRAVKGISECVHVSAVCDGSLNCTNGLDELNCTCTEAR